MTRWQKPFHHIPPDDYYFSKDYLLQYGLPLDYVPKVNNGIGPHERRYMNLMIAGIKPVVELDEQEYNLSGWKEAISKYGWDVRIVISRYRDGRLYKHTYVYLPGQEYRVDKLISCFNSFLFDDNVNKDRIEAKIGFLLGYTKECIAYYLYRRNKSFTEMKRLPVDIPEWFDYRNKETWR